MEVVGTSRQGKSSGNDDASIDMERLVKSIREKLDKLSSPSPECCIYKVPKKLRKINEEAYTPLRVSIGPLHHGEEGLKDMEEHKLRYFKDFMQRSGKSLKELVKIMEKKEKAIRESYAEIIKLKREIFLEIILVDAAFIIEVLLRYRLCHLRTPNDRIFRKPWMIYDIEHDLLLLENQIPFFVLQDLFKMTPSEIMIQVAFQFSRNETLLNPFIYLTLNWFMSSRRIQELPVLENINPSEIKHILDFLRTCLIPKQSSQPPEEKNPSKVKQFVAFLRSFIPRQSKHASVPEEISPSNSQASVLEEKSPSDSQALVPEEKSPSKVKQIIDCLISNLIPRQSMQQTERKFGIPSATELHEAGVKFKVSSSKNLFDIKFSGNILEIPHTRIADPTERLLRNIVAYEQCHCGDKFFADYSVIMDCLINTSKDVEFLVQAKIIESLLSDNNDVSNLFNGLGKEIGITPAYYFTKLHKQLNDYCEIPSHKWKATLRQDYCSTPWRVLSIIVAAILLGLTFIQSLCSLVSCHK